MEFNITKYYGDIPKEHLKQLEVLKGLENHIYEYGTGLPVLDVARGLTCIAYDYYSLDMEEEGDRLLKTADRFCPGYFKGPVRCQIDKDSEFASLVRLLQKTLALDVMISLGFER